MRDATLTSSEITRVFVNYRERERKRERGRARLGSTTALNSCLGGLMSLFLVYYVTHWLGFARDLLGQLDTNDIQCTWTHRQTHKNTITRTGTECTE